MVVKPADTLLCCIINFTVQSPKFLIVATSSLLFLLLVLIYFFPRQVNIVLIGLDKTANQLAAVVLSHNFKTTAQIKANYHAKPNKVRILIVPGHEPNFGGAEYRSLKERDMAVELAQFLQKILEHNPHYQVFVTRDDKAWSPEFAAYYQNNWDDIVEWRRLLHEEFSRLVALGSTTRTFSTVVHNDAPPDAAVRLYGLTKWSNENNIDIAIHIHFNDYKRSNTNRPGEYSGFAIYVPASQYGNSEATKAVADSVFKRLAKYNPVSNLPGEAVGIIDEPELIAVGVNNGSDAASVLIEYGYIYEPQFQDPALRSSVLKDLAFQTYLGLEDFFNESELVKSYGTLLIPHDWDNFLTKSRPAPLDVLALQTALIFDGVYPPNGKSKNDCARTGIIGPCTKASLDIFQNKYGINGERGLVGEQTKEKLNQLSVN